MKRVGLLFLLIFLVSCSSSYSNIDPSSITMRDTTFDPLYENESFLLPFTTENDTGFYYVQFHDATLQSEILTTFSFLNATPVEYWAENTYIISSDSPLESIAEQQAVRATGVYQPAHRIYPSFFIGTIFTEEGELIDANESTTFDLYFYELNEEIHNKITYLGATITKEEGNILVASIPHSKVVEILSIPELQLLHPSPKLRFLNDVQQDVAGIPLLTDRLGLTGSGEVITIADSGVDTHHPDLSNVIFIDDMGTGTTEDKSGHGTHVTATAVGTGLASDGVLSGVAPGAHAIIQAIGKELPDESSTAKKKKGATRDTPYFCFAESEVEETTRDLFLRAYGVSELLGVPLNTEKIFEGASIHSNSWGTCQGIYSPRVQQIDQYIFENPELTVLFAAGNYGSYKYLKKTTLVQRGGDSLTNNARAKNALVIGGTGSGRTDMATRNNSEAISEKSGKGNPASGRIKPDLVAPGAWILSALSQDCLDGEGVYRNSSGFYLESKVNFSFEHCTQSMAPSLFNLSYNDTYYVFKSGTSMATPAVAGMVALVREYYQKEWGLVPSSMLVKATLINGAIDLPDIEMNDSIPLDIPISCIGYPNVCEGWGRVNLSSSLLPHGNATHLFFADSEKITEGVSKEFTVSFIPGEEVTVTLVWHDRGGDALQNDLDLEVTTPSGVSYYGNTFGEHGFSEADKEKDPFLNNNVVEKVRIHRAEEGEYVVQVNAKRFRSLEDYQSFSLVASPVENETNEAKMEIIR